MLVASPGGGGEGGLGAAPGLPAGPKGPGEGAHVAVRGEPRPDLGRRGRAAAGDEVEVALGVGDVQGAAEGQRGLAPLPLLGPARRWGCPA